MWTVAVVRTLATIISAAAIMMPNLGTPARADAVPAELASLAAQLYRQTKDNLEQGYAAPSHQQAVERALWALKRSGIRYWARDPVVLPQVGGAAAKQLGLDLAEEQDRRFLSDLLRMPDEERRNSQV